jgi:heat shock protein beta
MKWLVLFASLAVIGTLLPLVLMPGQALAEGDDIELEDTNGATETSGTDSDTVQREAAAFTIDGYSADEYAAKRDAGEKHEFETEVGRIMKLIINSLYTNKEIFLRELISNGSDALDKARFLAVQNKDYLGENPDLHVKIHVDKENRVIHITDTGIGMTKKDLQKNLGTIAKSGTSEFLQAMSDGTGDTSNLIGQFGVGFYSAFLVADTVVVTSKNNDDDQYIWESDANSFLIMKDERPDEQLGRGTRVSIYLKEEAQDFLETDTIKNLIKKYSEFINFDIYLYTSKVIEVDADEEDDEEEVEEEEDDTEKQAARERATTALTYLTDSDDESYSALRDAVKKAANFLFDDESEDADEDGTVDSDETDEDGDSIPDDIENDFRDAREAAGKGLPEDVNEGLDAIEAGLAELEGDEEGAEEDEEGKKIEKVVWDWEIINANKPIWTRNHKDVSEEEYTSFYNAFAKTDGKTPLGHIHFTAEGEVTFRSILFVPDAAPQGMYNDYGKLKNNIKMYVRRVFITDTFEDMMPKYLSFITGVVDSDDLPLNVSRESLQQHKLLKVIKKKLVRKALDMLKKMDPEDYKKFWKEFGTSIKLGVIEDYSNRTRLSKLLRFTSSNSNDELTSLEDYVSRMKEKQESIYFAAGSSREEIEKSPFVERALKKGFEIIYLVEPVDEYTIQNLPEFDGKKFQNLAKEGIKFDESQAEKEAFEEKEKEFEPLTNWLGENLKEELEKAIVSQRLDTTPCAFVANQYGWTGNMQKIMTAQAYAKSGDSQNDFYKKQKKILEINPRNPVMKRLLQRVKDEEDLEGDDLEAHKKESLDVAQVMVDTARLRSGYEVTDQIAFAERMERMMRNSLGVDLDEETEPEPEYKDDEEEGDDEEEEEEGEEEEEEEEGEEAEETPSKDEL